MFAVERRLRRWQQESAVREAGDRLLALMAGS